MERQAPVQGEIYKHFKNRLYQIVGIATYSESREKLVIYQALYGTYAMYARPYDMFMSEVDHKKYPDVKQKYRFERVGRAGEEPDAVNIDDSEKPNADLIAFLDAETFDEKHKLLVAMAPRITDRLINDIAAAMDVTVEEGELETRYKSLLYCVSKFDEYEVNRLR